jgi:hypothetical protein
VKKKDALIAIVFPRIRNFSVNIEKIENETSLRLTLKPFLESREKQFISREIFVFI